MDSPSNLIQYRPLLSIVRCHRLLFRHTVVFSALGLALLFVEYFLSSLGWYPCSPNPGQPLSPSHSFSLDASYRTLTTSYFIFKVFFFKLFFSCPLLVHHPLTKDVSSIKSGTLSSFPSIYNRCNTCKDTKKVCASYWIEQCVNSSARQSQLNELSLNADENQLTVVCCVQTTN